MAHGGPWSKIARPALNRSKGPTLALLKRQSDQHLRQIATQVTAIRFNPPLKARHDALRTAGKPAKLSMTAIMRRITTIANALLRDGRKRTETMD